MTALLLATTLTLWHAYQADERAALERAVAAVNARESDFALDPLAIPFDAFATKLATTIPQGHGPDLFLAAHDRLGDWLRMGLVEPIGPARAGPLAAALAADGAQYAEPVGFKALLLYWNRSLLDRAPRDSRDLEALAARLPAGVYPLAYDTGSFYFHAPFFFAEGGRVFDGDRIAVFDDGPAVASFALVARLARERVMPGEADSRLAADLFNAGRAATALSGPWFAGDVRLAPDAWGVAPVFDVEGRPAGSFATVEGIYAARGSAAPVELRRRAAEAIAAALAAERARDPLAARLEAAARA
jgi:arabinogalactan oligomer/maltooligosaccharide transport system permease protein